MKKTRVLRLLCMAVFILASVTVKAQADSFDSDIMKMQQVNGSNGSTNALFPRIMAQIKQSKPDLTDSQISAMKLDVFDVEVASLNEQMIPVFKKYYTQSEVKEIIAFLRVADRKKTCRDNPKNDDGSDAADPDLGNGAHGQNQELPR